MLLACPNCDARYDVPDNAIPQSGRDVQCSNCGHAWFQLSYEAHEADEDVPAAIDADDSFSASYDEGAPGDFEDEIAHQDPDEAASPPVTAGFDADLPEGPGDEPDAIDAAASEVLTGTNALKAALSGGARQPAAAAPAAPPPVRRELDESVLEILRDEAEREAGARRVEAQRSVNRRAEAETGLQSQPELSMPPPPTPEMLAQQKRLAMLRGEDLDDDPAPEEASRPLARRDLLPDVEEINSTLQPGDGGFNPDAEIDALPDLTRGSFRTGFLLAMLTLIIAALIYIFSEKIIGWVPALESALTAYVAFIDNLRNWLNSMMDHATQALTSDEGPSN